MNRKINAIFAIATAIICIAASAHAQVLDTSILPMPIEGASILSMDQMDAAVLSAFNSANGYTVLVPIPAATQPAGSLSLAGDGFGAPPAPPSAPSSFSMFTTGPDGMSSMSLASAPSVPEPASLMVLASGVAGLFLKRKQ